MSKEQKKYYQIVRWVEGTVEYADALITVSDKIKSELIQNYPVKLEKIYHIPNGVDLDVFNNDQEFSDDKRILYVGRFSAEKGIDFILKIAREILRKNNEESPVLNIHFIISQLFVFQLLRGLNYCHRRKVLSVKIFCAVFVKFKKFSSDILATRFSKMVPLVCGCLLCFYFHKKLKSQIIKILRNLSTGKNLIRHLFVSSRKL